MSPPDDIEGDLEEQRFRANELLREEWKRHNVDDDKLIAWLSEHIITIAEPDGKISDEDIAFLRCIHSTHTEAVKVAKLMLLPAIVDHKVNMSIAYRTFHKLKEATNGTFRR